MSTKVYKRNECCLDSLSADCVPAATKLTVAGARDLGNDHPVEAMMIRRVNWFRIFLRRLLSCADSKVLVDMVIGV